jgi:hypothetical protein
MHTIPIHNKPFRRREDGTRVKRLLKVGLTVPNDYHVDASTGKKVYVPNRRGRRFNEMMARRKARSPYTRENNRSAIGWLRRNGKRASGRFLQAVEHLINGIKGSNLFRHIKLSR